MCFKNALKTAAITDVFKNCFENPASRRRLFHTRKAFKHGNLKKIKILGIE